MRFYYLLKDIVTADPNNESDPVLKKCKAVSCFLAWKGGNFPGVMLLCLHLYSGHSHSFPQVNAAPLTAADRLSFFD